LQFRVERTLKIKGRAFYWAEYRWDSGSERWVYKSANEGFFREYDLPSTFSEAERLLLEIQYSDS
jgi:hypothetical protein